MIFNFDQAHKYFVVRLGNPNLPHREALSTRCPFHGDRTASLSINLGKGGVWHCHACNVGGGLYDFEKRMFGESRDDGQLWDAIYKLTGAVPSEDRQNRSLGPVVATYEYRDEDGKLLFQKQRHEPKTFTQRAPKGTGWVYSLQGIRKPLYNLGQVMASRIIFICEGEKDCNNLTTALDGVVKHGDETLPATATCNFDGAGKWRDEYGPYFAGRRVVVLPDNDEPGRKHAADVARSVVKFALSVKVVELPGMAKKGDVSDFLKAHTVDELLAAVKGTPRFSTEPAKSEKPFFAAPAALLPGGAGGIEWIIPGIIHRGAKGLIVAQPKAGKSMIALDLAVALSSAQPWLGIQPTQVVRTAVVSREDGPHMTKDRLKQFAIGRNLDFASMTNLHVNTFEQRATFSIQDDTDLAAVCQALKDATIEVVIFDVLNKLHAADENSNTEMTVVMARFDLIREKTGCDVVVIHHDSKSAVQGAGKRPRGASSIDSWWDWKVSVSVDADDDARKDVFFATKAGMAHTPISVQFATNLNTGGHRIAPVLGNPRNGSAAA